MDIIVIYCTVPDKQIAKDITNILLKHKLVIEDIHPYTVPEIIALPIVDCSEDYLKWLVKETGSQG